MESRSISRLRNFLLHLAVFGCGAVVMVYEIVGSRVIAPYIGTSTYTWTSLIGVILAALSLGYWVGGKWADKNPSLRILAGAIFFAGGMIGLTVLIKDPFLSILSAAPLPIEVSAVFTAVVLFAPASVLLGFVTPYAVRLSIKSVEETGRTVGRLYALSTIGSITGTFLAGFVLVPFLGTSRTLYLLAAVLFAISISLVPLSADHGKVALIMIFVIGIAANEAYLLAMRSRANYFDIDTEYNRVRIFDTKKNGRPLRAMVIDPYIYQSSMYLDNGESGASYMRYYHLARHFKPGFSKSLMIGGAGYGFPKEYLRVYADATIDVVEIDPAMTRLARKHFGLREDRRLKSIHTDGRVFLNRSKNLIYEVVFIDAFNSLFSIPFQLTTVEAVQKIKTALTQDGVVLVNIGTAVSGDGSRFLDAETATYRSVFSNVRLFQVDASKAPDRIQNVILVASDSLLSDKSTDDGIAGMLRNEIKEARPKAEILTDDLAPVERLISIAQSQYASDR